ncbi:MAG: hypothetical protein KC616_23195 [Myxococcales bacterium]|nr:hypothetical protein [Myxococcales bacterium]
MAAQTIDINYNDGDAAISKTASGTVTNDVRVTWDDGASKLQVVAALTRALEWLKGQGSL